MTTTTKTPKSEASAREDEPAGRAVEALFGIGRLWAAHGLGVGRSALEASAITLRTTAELLGALSEKVGPAPEPDLTVDAGDLDPV